MSLLLTIEQGPHPQAMRQARLEDGELVIGRSAEADWQIDDPDKFVSRAHCRIRAERDGFMVTDMSSSGLFIDDARAPLGAGNSAWLKDGMRLRLGEYVLGVDIGAEEAAVGASPSDPGENGAAGPIDFRRDDFFSSREEAPPPADARPAGLPDPFDSPPADASEGRAAANADPWRSPAFDDPFSLDPVATPDREEERAEGPPRPPEEDPFAIDPKLPREARRMPRVDDFDFDGAIEAAEARHRQPAGSRPFAEPQGAQPHPWEAEPARPAEVRQHRAVAGGAAPAAPAQVESDLRAAFLRGLGIEELPGEAADAAAELERFGREYRLMMDGLMQLLRKRAEEKGSARVAQTVVGSSKVNPLKFLPSVDDALATLVADRSPGFLAADAAITDAVRDLAQHHVRAWRGVQGALRRMIDRFDPAAIEEELKSSSTIDTLLSGGRSAKLWELYRKRHKEIAASAESRFLGELGADFRDAYEEE